MIEERDCEHCAHHTERGCSVWNCEFEPRMTDFEIGKMLIDKGIENGIQAYKQGRADEREKVLDEVDTIIDFIKNNSFDHNLGFDSLKVIGSSVVISLLEQLKE